MVHILLGFNTEYLWHKPIQDLPLHAEITIIWVTSIKPYGKIFRPINSSKCVGNSNLKYVLIQKYKLYLNVIVANKVHNAKVQQGMSFVNCGICKCILQFIEASN